MDNRAFHLRRSADAATRDPRIGRLAVCQAGRIGFIERRLDSADGTVVYHGRDLDGRPWQSKAPRLICGKDEERLRWELAWCPTESQDT